MAQHPTMALWHQALETANIDLLDELLADEAVFYSPVMHRPQEGKDLTKLYLSAAFNVLVSDKFVYQRELVDEQGAVLEFLAEVDGVQINGVDMMRWNAEGKITEFKVMLRPYKAIETMRSKMLEMLEALNSASA